MKTTLTIVTLTLLTTLTLLASTPPKLFHVGISTHDAVSTYSVFNQNVTHDKLNELLDSLAKRYPAQTLIIQIDTETTGKTLLNLISECRTRGLSSFRIFIVDNGTTTELTIGTTTNGTPVDLLNSESDGKL